MDKLGNKSASLEIAMIKDSGPRVALSVIDSHDRRTVEAVYRRIPDCGELCPYRTLRLQTALMKCIPQHARMEFARYGS